MQPNQAQLTPQGPTLSRIVAGTMTWGEWGHDLSTNQMAELIGLCVEREITSFDHADIYGHYSTEAAFGEALAQLGSTARQQIQLISKCGIRLHSSRRPENRLKSYDTSKTYLIESAERSLRNLRTDYLDLFLIHRPDPLMAPAEIAEAFQQLKASGKVRHFGVSNFTPSQFALVNDAFPLVTNQIECNPLHTAPLFDGTLDQLLSKGIKPMIWSPLGGSTYFKGEGTAVLRLRDTVKTIADQHGVSENVILLAWLLRHPAAPFPVVGTANRGRLIETPSALHLELDRQDWFAILEAARGEEVA